MHQDFSNHSSSGRQRNGAARANQATPSQHHHQQQQQQQQQPPHQQQNGAADPTEGPRPKPVFFWVNADVMKWLKRHADEYYAQYGHLFMEHEITGRSLVRMSESTLERMGVTDPAHRDGLYRIILKQKLKSDILEMKDLEKKTSDSVGSSMTAGTG